MKEIVLIIIAVIVIAALFLPWGKWLDDDNVYNRKDSYQTGYNKALEAIKEGGRPQKLLDSSLESLTDDLWDKGWNQACKDNGAKVENYKSDFDE